MATRWTEADAKAFLKQSTPKHPRFLPTVRGYPCLEEVFLVLPYPPLNNRYYRHVQGHTVLSRDAHDYFRAVGAIIQVSWPTGVFRPFNNTLVVSCTIRPPSPRHRPDVDAPAKALLDSLQKAGVYVDDKQILDLHLYKRPPAPPTGMLEVLIQPYKEDV